MGSSEIMDVLDKAIAETKDLYVLDTLLDVKLSSSNIFNSTKINFNPSFILHEAVNIDLICSIFEKSTQICEDFLKPFKSIVEYITTNEKDIKCQSNIVRLLNYLVTICFRDGKVEILFNYLNPEFIYNFLIISLSNTELKSKAYETLTFYFKLFPRVEQIKCINAIFEVCFKNNNLDVFCALLNHIPKDVIYSEHCCLSDENFWLYVESCISGSQSHLQKQGEYILSKYIDSFTSVNAIKHIFISSDFKNSWQAFFVLIDMGREKQLHLITPSLDLFKYIFDLPFLWQKCVFKIFLGHSQTTIVYQVIMEILSRTYSLGNLKEILKLVFQAINKNEYTDLSCEVFEALGRFCAELDKTELEIVVKELVQISWNIVSFWKAIHNVFTCENKANLNIDLFHEVVCCALNLPHVYIRTDCIKHLVDVFWDEEDYNNIFKIIQSLKPTDNTYFQNRKISDEITYLVINDLLQFTDHFYDLQKNKICFMILECLNIDIWSKLHNCLQTLSPHVVLFTWRWYLLSNDINKLDLVTLYGQIEAFLIEYFNKYLVEETTDFFIEVFKVFICLFKTDTIVQVVSTTLYSSEKYNNNQIYVALVLLQELLFKHEYDELYRDMEINIKSSGSSVVIKFSKNFVSINDIEVKDSRICGESINLIFKLNKNEFSLDNTKDVLDVFTNFIEFQNNQILYRVSEKLYDLLLRTTSKNLVIDFVNVWQKKLLQIKKDQYFKDIVNEFIKLMYSELYLNYNIDDFASINNNSLELSESYLVIRLNLIKALRKLCADSVSYNELCLELVVDISIQGAITTKDERTEFNLCQEILCSNVENEYNPFDLGEFSNPNLLNAASRYLALETLLCIGHHDIELVINCLKGRYMRHFKKRYFPDSKIHYEKLRIVQALLLLVSIVKISGDHATQISSFVFKCFQEETNQNCVKQLLNWILILVLKDVSPVIKWINSRPANISPSVLISVMPTINVLALFGEEDILEKTLKMALPWTMGAQFRLRVYAQDLIRRILQCARQKRYIIFNKYQHLEDCITSCIASTGDIFLNTMKSDLVFLNDLQPMKDTSLSAIFYDIPRLNKVYPTEWQNMCIFSSGSDRLLHIERIPSPSNRTFASAVDRYLLKDESKVEQMEDQINRISHIQKKITPWKSALENINDEIKTNFILIASLVNKAQNLGGLSRTCEVFGIRDITFNDAKVTNEKEFKSLSMSSEAWINAVEVKVKDLTDYIVSLQGNGYCVIGAEQTAGSQKLNEFQFPRKMALILGNEKTGIPPDVIPLLNVCLEIPQFGQTRSLNVHVAGATFIWEYAKQHLV